MRAKWNDDQPIYRQLRDRTVVMILESALAEGKAKNQNLLSLQEFACDSQPKRLWQTVSAHTK